MTKLYTAPGNVQDVKKYMNLLIRKAWAWDNLEKNQNTFVQIVLK